MKTKPSTKPLLHCSIGICVFNEEKNIRKLFRSLRNQILETVQIDEIIVVISGSTDRTDQRVTELKQADKRIKILRQLRREGKASAVNLFIEKASTEILVLLGGDLLLTPQVIERLVNKFHNPEVGMSGARPIPVNETHSLVGFAGSFLWELHHRVSLQHPKMGEVIAFRKIFKRIPVTGADEASIEPLILCQGYKIIYVPDAVIYNKAPTTLSDFIRQRRRNYWLHLVVKHEQLYIVSTLRSTFLFSALLSFLADHPRPRSVLFVFLVVLLEIYSRVLGQWDYKIAKRQHTIWEPIETTKASLRLAYTKS